MPHAAYVHTLFNALLDDGAPGPIGMSGPLVAVNDGRAGLGLDPVGSFGALLERARAVLVTAPRLLDAPAPLPANVRYVGPVLEGPGPDAGWQPPAGDDPLVAVSLGTTDMGEVPMIQAVLDALAADAVRVVVTAGAHVDRSSLTVPTASGK